MALVVMVEMLADLVMTPINFAGLIHAAVVAAAVADDAAHLLMLNLADDDDDDNNAVVAHDTPSPFDSNPSNNVPNLSSNPQTPSRY